MDVFTAKGIALDPADARTLASSGRNFSRRNHLHALICSRDYAAGHRGVGSGAGRCFDPFPGQDASRFRRDPDPNDKIEAHADRETFSKCNSQTARQRHAGTGRDRNAFARAYRNRDPDSGPFASRGGHADDHCVANPNAAGGPDRDRHRETANHFSDCQTTGYPPRGDLNAKTDPKCFRDLDAETNRNCYRNGQSFAEPDAETQSNSVAQANSDAETESNSVAQTNSDTETNPDPDP